MVRSNVVYSITSDTGSDTPMPKHDAFGGLTAAHAGSRSVRAFVVALAAAAIAMVIAWVALAQSADAAAEVRVEGVITDAAGEPINGARIGQGDQLDITGKDGIFTLENIDSETRLRVFASGYDERNVRVADTNEPLEIGLETQPIKAIYLNPLISTTEADIDRLIELVDTTELNAIVVDIKEELVLYDTQVDLFNDAGTVDPVLDLDALLAKFDEHDIYSIARLVAFKDSVVAEQYPDLAVLNSETGELWRDMNGVAWVNPTNETLWDANADLAVEATRRGFDEIQYDYVRFPTDGDLTVTDFGVENTQASREAAIAGFLEMTSDRLWRIGGKLSADVFGFTVLVNDDLGIGQNFVKLAEHVDYLSPMVYPSHFPEGSIEVDGHPNSYPYETVEISMSSAAAKLPGQVFKVRPWLQDFTFFDLPPEYGDEEVRAQIDAAEDVGTSGWMLWDPNNVYRDGALASESEEDRSALPDTQPAAFTRAPALTVSARSGRVRR